MSSPKDPAPNGKGKDGPRGKGLEGKEGAIAAAAGVAVAVGIAWSVYRSVMARKEEDALIEEYYGNSSSRDLDYSSPPPVKDEETEVKEKVEEVAVAADESVETQKSERGWFFGGMKPKNPKHKPGKGYEIMRGDTLYSISQRHGVTVEALKAANGLTEDTIYYGETLTIP